MPDLLASEPTHIGYPGEDTEDKDSGDIAHYGFIYSSEVSQGGTYDVGYDNRTNRTHNHPNYRAGR